MSLTSIPTAAAEQPGPRLTPLDHLRAQILLGEQIKELPKPAPLLEDVLDLDSLAVLYGKSGSGKSFVSVDWALSIATGSWWFGRRVEQGSVLYVIAEGAGGMGARVGAWQSQRRVNMTGDVHWLPLAVNLFKPEPKSKDLLAHLAAELKPRLVVVDTFARCAIGADENSARDVGIVVEQLDTVRRASGACVLLVHHSGKDTSAGLRGSSALEGAVDTSIRCEGAEGLLSLVVEKQKHHASGQRIRLRLVAVDDSCALEEHRGAEPGELLASDRQALEALASIEVPGGVPSNAWDKASDLGRTFWNARKRLLDAGEVRNIGTDSRPKYLTTATATALQEN